MAAAFGEDLEPVHLADLAFQTEEATDSIAFGNRAALFGSRVGRVFEDLAAPVPPAAIVGVNLAPEKKVETASVKFDYPSWYVQNFSETIRTMREAEEKRDLQLLAVVATDSAGWNQQRNITPFFYPVMKELHRQGALGGLVAHTGTVMGGIFPQVSFDDHTHMGGPVVRLMTEFLKDNIPVTHAQLFRIDTGDEPGILYSTTLAGLDDLAQIRLTFLISINLA